MPTNRLTSLITGASAGLGMTFARVLAARGHDLILTARRTERLQTLATELQALHHISVTVLPTDLGQVDEAMNLYEAIQQRELTVDWLINNAGYGVPGTFEASDWPVHMDFLRVLLIAPTELTWHVLPGMHQRGYGRIINVASLAGLVPGSAGHTLYAASKAYLIKFSQSLALENHVHGVHVCALCPGFTWTEFHDVTGTRSLVERLPRFMWQNAETVVSEGITAIESGKVVHVTGRVNRFIKTLVNLLPDKLAWQLSARYSRHYRDL